MQSRKSCEIEFDGLEYDSRRDSASGACRLQVSLVFHEARETR
jgi:hypothetical protein